MHKNIYYVLIHIESYYVKVVLIHINSFRFIFIFILNHIHSYKSILLHAKIDPY
jgi:hypothetical protein